MCVGVQTAAVTEPAVSGGSAAGELAGGLKLSSGACHSAGPLIIPSLPRSSASKGLDAHALGGPDATLEAPSSQLHVDRRRTQRAEHPHIRANMCIYFMLARRTIRRPVNKLR